jgi:TPR repeat protein
MRARQLKHSEAMIHLGIMYQHGIGVNKDEDKALEMFEEASQYGSLALMYLEN